MKFRKKPVVIDAEQFDGSYESAVRLVAWIGGELSASVLVGERREIDIVTREGVMTAQAGDWIIRGVMGEFYPCKPEVFAITYEPVDAAAALAPHPARPEKEE